MGSDISLTDRKVLLVLLPVALLVLAAVLTSGVLDGSGSDEGESREDPPQSQWFWTDGDGEVTLEHGGGAEIDDPEQIRIEDSNRGPDHNSDLATVGGQDRITWSDEMTIDVGDGNGTVRLVWESEDGSETKLLAEHEYSV